MPHERCVVVPTAREEDSQEALVLTLSELTLRAAGGIGQCAAAGAEARDHVGWPREGWGLNFTNNAGQPIASLEISG